VLGDPREPEDNGELIVEGEGKVNERESQVCRNYQTKALTNGLRGICYAPTDDTPPPEASPHNRQQSGFPSGRIDGGGHRATAVLGRGRRRSLITAR